MSGYQDIDFQKARDILDREADSVLLDVREEEEFITGHPMEAELLPLSTLGPAAAASAAARPPKSWSRWATPGSITWAA